MPSPQSPPSCARYQEKVALDQLLADLKQDGYGFWKCQLLAGWEDRWVRPWQLHREFDALLWRGGIDRDMAAEALEELRKQERGVQTGYGM